MDAENTYIKQEYDRFRKKMVKALRVIYQLSTEQMTDSYYQKLQELRLESKKQLKKGPDLKTLITENKITTDMASSLVNDHDHLHEVIKKLIDVAQLLYSTKDPLLEVDKQEQTSLSAA